MPAGTVSRPVFGINSSMRSAGFRKVAVQRHMPEARGMDNWRLQQRCRPQKDRRTGEPGEQKVELNAAAFLHEICACRPARAAPCVKSNQT